MRIGTVCGAWLLLTFAAGTAQAQDADAGREIFNEKADPPCAICHMLKDAAAEGEIGPDLDDLKPDAERVRQAVANGLGVMPAYGELLSEAEIDAVAQYVAGAAGAPKE